MPPPQKTYKFVDKQGVVHFVDSLDKVPHEDRDRVQEIGGDVSVVSKKAFNRTAKVPVPEDPKKGTAHHFTDYLVTRPELLGPGVALPAVLVLALLTPLGGSLSTPLRKVAVYGALLGATAVVWYLAWTGFTRDVGAR